MIHDNYNKLSAKEKAFVDQMFNRETFKRAEAEIGYKLLGDDRVEVAIEAVATWLIESAKEAGFERFPHQSWILAPL